MNKQTNYDNALIMSRHKAPAPKGYQTKKSKQMKRQTNRKMLAKKGGKKARKQASKKGDNQARNCQTA